MNERGKGTSNSEWPHLALTHVGYRSIDFVNFRS